MLPNDYLERVYGGILGKLIGVYLGRPFEGWTHERIMRELGPITYYVNDRTGDPLVVTDDDVAGTFTFLRALSDFGVSADLTSEEIGRTWLNYLIENRSILWWGGMATSTEHTAWLNLKRGIPAPRSGSIAVNGTTVAEQIGAQIFIDGWAMVAPGNPALAARLAERAAKVSHDGESVHAAVLWAAMEAEAFVNADINHLIDVGLTHIPAESRIARLIADVRAWRERYSDWRDTRREIAENYGYDKYPGVCHVVPNHALMIMAVLYAPEDFQGAQTIVNTSGWDTDCNAGNVGCLLGIMNGLAGLDTGPDWRGPVADRCLISSADGGYAVNDAVRLAYAVASLGHQLAGGQALPLPKEGAQFHFSLPGSVQGFAVARGEGRFEAVTVSNHDGTLALDYAHLAPGQTAAVLSPTFAPADVGRMRTYELMATPTLYPGQTVAARLRADPANRGALACALRISVLGENDARVDLDSDSVRLAPGETKDISWRLPDLDGQPVAAVGVAFSTDERMAAGRLSLDYLRWDGVPEVSLHRPAGEGDGWRRAWVNGVSHFSRNFAQSFRISQAEGEGMIIHGTRLWTDYRVASDITPHLCRHAGLAIRVQNLRRYYAVRLTRDGWLELVRMRDGDVVVLARKRMSLEFDHPYRFMLEAAGATIRCAVDGVVLEADDAGSDALQNGGIALVVAEGAISADRIDVGPASKL